MMRAMGMSDADIDAPFVGVASTHNEVTPCNAGIKPLVDEIKVGVRATGGSPFEFGTITVSDAISMGTEGMRGSLDKSGNHRRLDRDGMLRRTL